MSTLGILGTLHSTVLLPPNSKYEAMALVVPIRKMGKNLGLPLKIEDFGEL